jgi:hypothetical protein
MGKGGEQSVGKSSGVQGKPLKLDSMPTEELRKWAKAYGINSEKDREWLLKELVGYDCAGIGVRCSVLLILSVCV